MSARADDDAFTWEGDHDPTLETGVPDSAPVLPEGYTAVGKAAETVGTSSTDPAPAADTVDEEPPAERDSMGNTALVILGLLGGFYLLFTIGWLIGGFRLQGSAQYLVADVMFQGSFWLAVLAPALWFGTVYLLTRRSAVWVRIVWLVAGAILLVPWPFIMVGAVGR